MSTVPHSSARRRGQRLWVLLRPILTGIALLVVFYAIPLDRKGSIIALLIGVGALAVLVAWQIHAVTTSPSPRLRAVESLATSIPLYIVLFASSHATMSYWDPNAFSEPLDRTDSLYFTITTLATVGYGDIVPVSQAARVSVTVQMVTGLVLLGLVIKMFVGAVDVGLRNAADKPASQSEADRLAPDHQLDDGPAETGGPEAGIGGPAGPEGPEPGTGGPAIGGPASR
ncbi:two pore domain potassium channel family protein [Arthrobacter sp. CAU 1506]|uniref:ion channel n=1 Tax=Arthrobacter sp. CAU 1506 TaxID=2560052 RepID=UPI0010AD550C|nr:ion channel [Arthrobacter sp. CAU 1506]TJY69016.1 two pore domain potassium channel family protein [Arthrobacter sp. CAU 1506]